MRRRRREKWNTTIEVYQPHTEVMTEAVTDLFHSIDLPSIQIETLIHLSKPSLTWNTARH